MARRYQKVQKLLPEIKWMLESGMSQGEVAERLGLEGDRPIHDLLKRERKKATQVTPKQRERKPARTLQEYKYENKRLKMENVLLRDFITLMVRTPLKKCSLTADDGASPPLEWCTASAEMVHGGRGRGAPGRHAGDYSGMPLRLRMDSPSIWMV